MSALEQLGFVTCRSGALIIIDTGYLGIWSHDRPPILPDDALDSAEATERANNSVDFRIVGTDAERAGRLLEMSWHPLYVYDQPLGRTEIQTKLEEITQEHQLDARVEVVFPRIPHRQRAALALQHGNGAGETQFHGVPAAVISGVPVDTRLRVLGERMPPPEFDRWKHVFVECRLDQVERSEVVANVGVDYARLLIADIDALGSWKHEASLDGLADFVFWGRDAERAAGALRAPTIDSDSFGWLDVTEATAKEHGISVEDYRDRNELKIATDYRPHSHHWRVMQATRTSPTESGMTELHGVTVCNFMTSWGDGLFDVYRDVNKTGQLVRLRIELAQ